MATTDETMRRAVEAGARALGPIWFEEDGTPPGSVTISVQNDLRWKAEAVIRAALPGIGEALAEAVLGFGDYSDDAANALRARLAEMLGEKG
ncbi:hypothetical protein LB518_23040 [Mesorhizobium sp. BR1-1-16]|uniref:hypothetical protein n=1 Tax=Mesorhizobium sp. BR1-1-16 TaxID=2876653 RepID=UPI001CCD6A25|nr:hypothetical protein [Mesorhizobium sp. BR1-1-16]MBZ9939192.1 hypothetical protein [Mesorhizobium sp. BR1-1-16]